MANQGILAKAKPAATTNTVLYSAPIDSSASTVLNVTAQGGSNTSYDVVLKDYDQKLTLDASTYKLHKGDLVTGYRFTVGTAIPATAGFTSSQQFESDDREKKVKFESFYIPAYTEIFVKKFAIRQIAIESITGTFAVGETVVKGSGGNTATATVYAIGTGVIHIGPTTLAGSGAEFAAGDSITASGGATATISSGGVGTAGNEFCFSTTTAGGTYNMYLATAIVNFKDRAYRFNVADASMSGLLFKISDKENGEWGADNTFGTADDNTEYTTGKTTNGTAGSSGAYVQYDWSANNALGGVMYFYEGTTGTAANSAYGGSDRFVTLSTNYTYTDFYVYDVEGTWVNSTDAFTTGGTTYTVTGQTAGPYGYIKSYSGTTAYVVKGTNSADFANSDTFNDVPALNTATRSTVTVSSVGTATAAYETQDVVRKDNAITANTTEEIKSLVIGPGQRLIVENNDADCSFTLIGFEDASTAFTTRVYGST